LLRLLATALPPSSGQLTMLGLDPTVPAERTEVRRQLGYLKEWTQADRRHAEVCRVLDLVGLSGSSAKRLRGAAASLRGVARHGRSLIWAIQRPGQFQAGSSRMPCPSRSVRPSSLTSSSTWAEPFRNAVTSGSA
jgi:hypothetical protein